VASGHVLDKRRIDASTREVVFVLDLQDLRNLGCDLLARLVAAEDGRPLPGRAYIEDEPIPMRPALDISGDGVLHFAGQRPQEQWLIVEAEGRARFRQHITFTAGQTLDLGDLPLHEPIAIGGHVRTEAGTPLEAMVIWGRLDPLTRSVDWEPFTYAKTKPDGSFRIPGLEPGLWQIQAPARRTGGKRTPAPRLGSLPLSVDASTGSVDGVELVAHAVTRITMVCKTGSKPRPLVQVLDEQGLQAASAKIGSGGQESEVFLPRGSYQLVLSRDELEFARRSLDVDSEPQRIELSFD
jgi:hypothetical protein